MSNKKGNRKNSKRISVNHKLTVKTLEEVLRNVSNKNLPILVGDRNGDDPERGVKALLIMGKGNQIAAVAVCGGWKWREDDEEDKEDDEIDPHEDVDDMTAWDMAYSANQATKTPQPEPGDCVKVDGVKLVYLGAGKDAASG